MDQTTRRDDILPIVGTYLGYVNAGIYLLFCIYMGRIAISKSICLFEFPIYVCIIIWVILVLMVAAASEVGRGIKSRRADLLIGFLVISIITDITAIVLLYYSTEQIYIIVISVVLGFTILSWFPIFILCLRFRSERLAADREHPSHELGENCPLNPQELGINAVVLLNSTHHNAANYAATPVEDNEEASIGRKPPSYDAVMNVPGSNPLQSQVESVIGREMDSTINLGSIETDV